MKASSQAPGSSPSFSRKASSWRTLVSVPASTFNSPVRPDKSSRATTLWSACLIRKQREVSGKLRTSSNSCSLSPKPPM